MTQKKQLTVKTLNKHWLGATLFTVFLMGLIVLAIGDVTMIWMAVIAAIGGITFCLLYLFPSSPFFYIVFNNGILLYCGLFFAFVECVFQSVPLFYLVVGFLLPLAAFLTGAIWRRKEILLIVTSNKRGHDSEFLKSLAWLIPVFIIGVFVSVLPVHSWAPVYQNIFFISAMALISGVVLFVSRDITILLMDTALYFSDFLKTASELVKPAFAFFSIYTMNVIIFACLYRLIDRFSDVMHFQIEGVKRGISFVESLYFSIVTVSTLGYGDIMPLSYLVRFLVGVQIVSGILLVLFGVHAILIHMREREE